MVCGESVERRRQRERDVVASGWWGSLCARVVWLLENFELVFVSSSVPLIRNISHPLLWKPGLFGFCRAKRWDTLHTIDHVGFTESQQ